MPRQCRFFDQPQTTLGAFRATKTGVGIVNQKYCVELQYAANPGDLLDEIATGKYVIVPNHQIPVEANGKGSLDALLALTVAQHSLLRSKLSSAPAFTSSYKVSFEDLKTLNGKRQRVEAFDSQLQQLVSDYKITDSDSFLADRAQAKKDVRTKASFLAMADSERNAKVIKAWHDPDVQMQHLNVKMNSLTSGDSWSILRDQLGLKDMLTPTYLLKDLKKAVDKFTMEEMGMQEFVFDAKESTPEDPQFVRGTSMSLRHAMSLAIDVWKKECQALGFNLPRNLKWKLTLDGRPLAGHDQVCIGMVPLIPGFKWQSSDSVYPLMLFNGKESKHNLHAALKGLAEEMREIKASGLVVDGQLHTVSYLLCCDMSSLWKIFIDKKFGDDFCVFCHVSKKGRWDLNNPEFQIIRTDLICIFPVELTEVVFCGLHARIRIVDKLMAQLAQTAYDNGSQKGVRKLVDAVRLARVDCFNINAGDLKPTALIGGNCTKILANYKTIVAAVEEPDSDDLRYSLEVWESVYQIDQAMRANSEHAKKYLDPASEYFNVIEKLCSDLSTAYQKRYSVASPDPENEGCFQSGLDAVDVNFYIHYVVAHMPSLLKRFVPMGLSIGDLSQEGFESSHKYHRLIYARAINHDGGKARPGQRTSMTQILLHQYALLLHRAGRLTYDAIKIYFP